MTTAAELLDETIRNARTALSGLELPERCEITLTIGAHAAGLKGLGQKPHEQRLATVLLDHFRPVTDALRREMPHTGWPVLISMSLRKSYWQPLELENCGLAGVMARSGRLTLAEVQAGAELIASLTHGDNGPVRLWSMQRDMMGSRFVHIEEIHAGSEAEFVLKKLFLMYRMEMLEKIRDQEPLPAMDWLEKASFVSADITDLDLHPQGRRVRGGHVLAQIAEGVARRQPSDNSDFQVS